MSIMRHLRDVAEKVSLLRGKELILPSIRNPPSNFSQVCGAVQTGLVG